MRFAAGMLGLALVLCSSRARADAPPLIERGRFGLVAGVAIFFPSGYQRALESFGFGARTTGVALSAHWTSSIGRLAVLGARVGYLHTEAGAHPWRIGFNFADVSAIGGLRLRTSPTAFSPRVELLGEAGAVLGDASLRGEPQWIGTFRAAGSVFVGADDARGGWYVGVRSTLAYVPWGGAGGSFFDPAFAQVNIAIEGGFR